MTDMQLLEAAAAAGSIEVWRGTGDQAGMLFRSVTSPDGKVTAAEWNPLTDDGDALRLAVALRNDVTFSDALAMAWPANGAGGESEPLDPAPYAATRRAIVRAAAAMAQTERAA